MFLILLFLILILRYLSASEAVWKILQLRITDRSTGEQIIFRLDNKKMMHSERLALLTRWLAKLGSEFLLFGLVKSFSGARSRRC